MVITDNYYVPVKTQLRDVILCEYKQNVQLI